MTDPANSSDKPSPSDTPTDRPEDNGGKSVVKLKDREYHEKDADFGNIANGRENEEEPVNPRQNPPNEFKDPETQTP